jgi:nucleoside-diphosphate-sugar epimerase
VLVTGGSGFIGSHIVEDLAKSAESNVVVYDVNSLEKDAGRVVSIRGDVFDSERLLAVMRKEGVSKVVHMVGLASISDCRENPDASFRLNVSSVHRVLEAMRIADVERLVFPSTAAVYGVVPNPKVDEAVEPKPTSIYGWHKLAAESLIRGYAKDYGVTATILRIFNVYGNLLREQGVTSTFIRSALKALPLTVNGGEQLRDFVHLNDVVEAFMKSLGEAAAYNKVINVGSGVGLSISEVAGMIREAFPDTEVAYRHLGNGEYSIFADVSKMRKLLGLQTIDPRVGIPAFIKRCKWNHVRVGKERS